MTTRREVRATAATIVPAADGLLSITFDEVDAKPPVEPGPNGEDRRFANRGYVTNSLRLDGPAGTVYDCRGTCVRVVNTGRNWSPPHGWRLAGPQPGGMAYGGAMVGNCRPEERWNGIYPEGNTQSGFFIDDARSHGFCIKGFYWRKIWDGPRVGWDRANPGAARDVVIEGCYGEEVRDDFVENDMGTPFSIIDCCANGCTSGMSASNKDAKFTGVVVTIENTIIWLKPYNLSSQLQGPGLTWETHGGAVKEFLKVDDVTLVLRNCVFATDRVSNVPTGSPFMRAMSNATFRTVENCRFFWLGSGDTPPYPKEFSLSHDREELEELVAAWQAGHPEVRAP